MRIMFREWIDLHEIHIQDKLTAGDPFRDDGRATSLPSGDIHGQTDPEAYLWQCRSAPVSTSTDRLQSFPESDL